MWPLISVLLFCSRGFHLWAWNFSLFYKMNEMIDNLKTEMRLMIEEISWMSDATKTEAYDKLERMGRNIGYPDTRFSKADIEKKYENYPMVPDHYYNNLALIRQLPNIERLYRLRDPVNYSEWFLPPHKVDAFYNTFTNEMVFLAGILQPPYFSQTFQDAINYGGIGVVIGHEITHGFDDRNSQFDADGNLRNWWQDSDKANLKKRSKCIVDQYSNVHVSHVNMSLRGINVQGEAVAELGGVKESFRAYKELVRRQGEQPTLPGLGLTPDQVFFLAYGQLWCEKMTLEMLTNQIMTGYHPPGIYRSIGTLQNSKEFAEAFNCPIGSYMNPTEKCEVW